MRRKRINERRWKLEEPKKEIIVPTLKEIMEKEGLSLEEAAKRGIFICGQAHKKSGVDCFRKRNDHKLCDGCPKYSLEQTKGTIKVSE